MEETRLQSDRFTRIENTIEKLANSIIDLKEITAASVVRISQIEKDSARLNMINDTVSRTSERLLNVETQMKEFSFDNDRYRENLARDIKNFYAEIKKDNENMFVTREKAWQKMEDSIERVETHLDKAEKTIYMYMGGLSVIVFLLSYGSHFLKIFTAVS